MTNDINHLLDSLNLFIFLLLLQQNPKLISTINKNLHLPGADGKNEKNSQNKKPLKTDQLNGQNISDEQKSEGTKRKNNTEGHSFRDKLSIHSKRINYVKISIIGGGPDSIIEGFLVKLHKDFITLFKAGEKINIPVDKITTLTAVNPGNQHKFSQTEERLPDHNHYYITFNQSNTGKFHQLPLPLYKTISLPAVTI